MGDEGLGRVHTCPIHPTRVDSSEALDDSTRFAPPEVKTREIIMHETYLTIRQRHLTIRLDSHHRKLRPVK